MIPRQPDALLKHGYGPNCRVHFHGLLSTILGSEYAPSHCRSVRLPTLEPQFALALSLT